MEPRPRDALIVARPVAAERTRPLRQAVLRPHQAAEELVFPGDDGDATLHVGAFRGADDELLAVGSIYHEPLPDDAADGDWRIRGMAVRPDQRRTGCGRIVLEAALAHARARGGSRVWCNARTPALPFYRACGFEAVGDEVELPGIGPHRRMWRDL